MFSAMMEGIKEESVGSLFNLQVQRQDSPIVEEAGRGRGAWVGRSSAWCPMAQERRRCPCRGYPGRNGRGARRAGGGRRPAGPFRPAGFAGPAGTSLPVDRLGGRPGPRSRGAARPSPVRSRRRPLRPARTARRSLLASRPAAWTGRSGRAACSTARPAMTGAARRSSGLPRPAAPTTPRSDETPRARAVPAASSSSATGTRVTASRTARARGSGGLDGRADPPRRRCATPGTGAMWTAALQPDGEGADSRPAPHDHGHLDDARGRPGGHDAPDPRLGPAASIGPSCRMRRRAWSVVHGVICPCGRDPASVSARTWANWLGHPAAGACTRRPRPGSGRPGRRHPRRLGGPARARVAHGVRKPPRRPHRHRAARSRGPRAAARPRRPAAAASSRVSARSRGQAAVPRGPPDPRTRGRGSPADVGGGGVIGPPGI